MLKGNRIGRRRGTESEEHLRTETCWQCKGPEDGSLKLPRPMLPGCFSASGACFGYSLAPPTPLSSVLEAKE